MEIILREDVQHVGKAGEVVKVKDGYARNFLLPTGKAMMADAGALKNWERHREEREARDRSERESAEAMAEGLRAMKIEIAVKAGEKSRLFGSVTNREIAAAISKEGIEIDRHAIHLREPIKTLGEFKADVHLMAGVDAQVAINVVPL